MKNKPIRYISFCSGVEAATLAWRPLGWEAVAFSEIEPFPSEVLKQRFPDVPNLGDCTKIHYDRNTEELYVKEKDGAILQRIPAGKIDLCVGGFPCQSFSLAGQRQGLEGASGLILEYFRLLDEIRPRWVVYENVPGMLSSQGGNDFRIILEGFQKCGYSCAWRILDAQYTRVPLFPRAVPQRRRRVFVVGYRGGALGDSPDWLHPAKVLFDGEMREGDTPPGREKRQNPAGGAQAGSDTAKFWDGGDTAGTVTTRSHHQLMPDKQQLQCVIEEPSRLDLRQIEAQESGVAPMLIATDYKGGKAVCFENHAADSRIADSGETAPTLTGRAGTGGNNLPLIMEAGEPLAFIKNDAGGDMQGYWKHTSPTLRSRVTPAVAIAENIIGRQVQNGGNGIGAKEEVAYTQNATGVMGVAQNAVVRKLLPVECERLMAFPDNWTRIPWKGKPEEDCPDSPRYKACGNSMCVNVMNWLGLRIAQEEQRIKENKDNE